MKSFYLKPIEETIAYKLAPKLPAGFFTPKRNQNNNENKGNSDNNDNINVKKETTKDDI